MGTEGAALVREVGGEAGGVDAGLVDLGAEERPRPRADVGEVASPRRDRGHRERERGRRVEPLAARGARNPPS